MRPSVLVGLAAAECLVLGCGQAAGDGTRVAPTEPSSVTATAASAPSTSSGPSSQEGTSSPPAEIRPTESSIVYPSDIRHVEVDDGTAASVAALWESATLVTTGTVQWVHSLGRPDLAEDEYADEFVAITIAPEEVLKGDEPAQVVLGWDALGVNPNGERVATLLANGLPPPIHGDRLLLFLVPADPAFVEALGGVPTHQFVQLDGVAYLDEAGNITETEDDSPLADAGTVSAVVDATT